MLDVVPDIAVLPTKYVFNRRLYAGFGFARFPVFFLVVVDELLMQITFLRMHDNVGLSCSFCVVFQHETK